MILTAFEKWLYLFIFCSRLEAAENLVDEVLEEMGNSKYLMYQALVTFPPSLLFPLVSPP